MTGEDEIARIRHKARFGERRNNKSGRATYHAEPAPEAAPDLRMIDVTPETTPDPAVVQAVRRHIELMPLRRLLDEAGEP